MSKVSGRDESKGDNMKGLFMLAVVMIPAYWTGNSQQFTTPQGNPAIRCEYKVAGYRPFWKSFAGFTCPQSVEVY